jgi:hypothetical protein
VAGSTAEINNKGGGRPTRLTMLLKVSERTLFRALRAARDREEAGV